VQWDLKETKGLLEKEDIEVALVLKGTEDARVTKERLDPKENTERKEKRDAPVLKERMEETVKWDQEERKE